MCHRCPLNKIFQAYFYLPRAIQRWDQRIKKTFGIFPMQKFVPVKEKLAEFGANFLRKYRERHGERGMASRGL